MRVAPDDRQRPLPDRRHAREKVPALLLARSDPDQHVRHVDHEVRGLGDEGAAEVHELQLIRGAVGALGAEHAGLDRARVPQLLRLLLIALAVGRPLQLRRAALAHLREADGLDHELVAVRVPEVLAVVHADGQDLLDRHRQLDQRHVILPHVVHLVAHRLEARVHEHLLDAVRLAAGAVLAAKVHVIMRDNRVHVVAHAERRGEHPLLVNQHARAVLEHVPVLDLDRRIAGLVVRHEAAANRASGIAVIEHLPQDITDINIDRSCG
mmetsp:Transcript_58408/g.137145  ORF Transcript_58408/g.137145 Transcript_58408/m.137145 type:complete len:267 (-) Transcript_58408:2311-3111(-)